MNNDKLKVTYNNDLVGILIYKNNLSSFQYSKDWINKGFSISPLQLPLTNQVFTSESHPFSGLFGIFNDSLPDGWGQLLVDRFLRKKSINPNYITPLDRLAMVGKSAMGALEYTPQEKYTINTSVNTDLDYLQEQCKALLDDNNSDDLDYLFKVGGSSGGARPKIFKQVNNEEWIIKFPSSIDSKEIGLQEYQYSLCAKKCGIDIPQVKLFNSKNCSGYFGIKRFDRDGGNKIHMASVSALLNTSHRLPNLDYTQLLKLSKFICKDDKEVKKLFRQMCFNIYSHNRDDHSNNFSFLYKDKWSLSPAYDLTYSNSMNGEHATTIAGEGKNPTINEILKVSQIIGISKSYAKQTAQEIQEIVSTDLAKYIK